MGWVTSGGGGLVTATPRPSPRQQVLLEAGTRVVAGAGLRGLTHRAVDREAGLAEGTCSAYLRTRLALLTALSEHVAARFADDIEHATHRIEEESARSGPPGSALAETSALLRGWLADPDLLLARMELTLEGVRQPELAAVFARQSEQLVDLVAHAMASLQREGEDLRARAGTVIAALDGVLLRALRQDPEEREQTLEASVTQLLEALLGAHPA